MITRLFFYATILCSLFPVLAQETENTDSKKPESKITSELLSGLKVRNIGPALMSGRIADIAIDPVKPNTWYVAAGSGNLWKTVNAGTTWTAIFDKYASYSIGCVTITPSDRHTIWVGSGEDVGGRHVGFGDGVYKSKDGGQTFTNVGLAGTEHIAKILVHTRNPDVVYVAAQGPLWSPGGERGLYKTVDGGETWTQCLSGGPYTGVTDVEMDPRDPNTLYAVTHQRHRTVWALLNGGPETAIHKSTDGGKTWRKLGQGLPAEDMGKISIDISPQQPDVIYATIELADRLGGFWKSSDAGETWIKQSDHISGGTGPHYYQEVWCDPHRFDCLYQADVRLVRSVDGGKTWNIVESQRKHVDNHAVAFHPNDPDFLLVGCDGGLYKSSDFAATYSFFANLPLTQFYKVDIDNSYPFYNIVGGTQDNSTQYGPSRTLNDTGIRNSDWRTIIGGDGHDCAIDPKEPNIIYCEAQQGFIRRYDHQTGQAVDIRPRPGKGEDGHRYNWDAPILISPHSNTRVYHGSRRLYQTDDRGNSWKAISPDLSRNLDRYKLKMMQRVWSIDAIYDLYAMSQYSNITSVSESPLKEGLIYIGTDDGLIQITEDGGKNWRRVDKVYGIPEFSFVNDVKADLHDVNTVYATLDNHKTGDYKPYIIKSNDKGVTWQSISGDLPAKHLVWRLVQDHVDSNLLFAGTEFGLFVTLDGGHHWTQLKGNVPTIPFRDLAIQQRDNDLVAASFGRGFFVLDDYSSLRHMNETELSEKEMILFPVRTALQFVPARVFGSRNGSQGDSFYSADNPPAGAVFTYYLKDPLQTRKQVRHKKEDDEKKKSEDSSVPDWDALRKEQQEESPELQFTIKDPNGNIVNRVTGVTTNGLHRISWNLRYPDFTGQGNSGPLVAPGVYSVTASKMVDGARVDIGDVQEFEVVSISNPSIPVPERAAVLAFQRKVGELQRTAVGANNRIDQAKEEIAAIQQMLKNTPNADPSFRTRTRMLELELNSLSESLVGDSLKASKRVDTAPSLIGRIGIALSGTLNNIYGPTTTHTQQYDIAFEEYQALAGILKKSIEETLKNLKRDLDAAGLPWTAGRSVPELKKLP